VIVRPNVRIRSSSRARPMNGTVMASERYARGVRSLGYGFERGPVQLGETQIGYGESVARVRR
jgi:hypothetical protein